MPVEAWELAKAETAKREDVAVPTPPSQCLTLQKLQQLKGSGTEIAPTEPPRESEIEGEEKTPDPPMPTPPTSGPTEPVPVPGEQRDMEFPMVTREVQQAFKGSRASIKKMDAAAGGSEEPVIAKPKGKGKGRGRGGAKKRPAAKDENTRPLKMASPVRVLGDSEVEEEEVKDTSVVKDLRETFELVADEEVESPEKKKKKLNNAVPKKRSNKKGDPVPKATPKTRSRGKTEKLSPAAKKLAAKAKAKGSDKKGSSKGAKDTVTEEEVTGKKTFAGRRCPKTSPEAILRFECLRTAFQNKIQKNIANSVSYLEAGFGAKSKLCLGCPYVLKVGARIGRTPKTITNEFSFQHFQLSTLQIKWWDFAFKALKNENSATKEEYMAICNFQADKFLKDDSFSTKAKALVFQVSV